MLVQTMCVWSQSALILAQPQPINVCLITLNKRAFGLRTVCAEGCRCLIQRPLRRDCTFSSPVDILHVCAGCCWTESSDLHIQYLFFYYIFSCWRNWNLHGSSNEFLWVPGILYWQVLMLLILVSPVVLVTSHPKAWRQSWNAAERTEARR